MEGNINRNQVKDYGFKFEKLLERNNHEKIATEF